MQAPGDRFPRKSKWLPRSKRLLVLVKDKGQLGPR